MVYLTRSRWYTARMTTNSPRLVRRIIMELLYERFLEDPMQMMTPTDITDTGKVTTKELIPCAHYLHDRNLIELMIGYNPPLFAATRIAPEGIDLVEDPHELDKMFPRGLSAENTTVTDLIKIVLQVMDEAESADLEGKRREWLLNDVDALRSELVEPEPLWRADVILSRLQWLDGFFDDDETLPSLGELRAILHERLL